MVEKHDGDVNDDEEEEDEDEGEGEDLPPLGFLSVMMKAEDVPVVQENATRSRSTTFTKALCIFVFFLSLSSLCCFFFLFLSLSPSILRITQNLLPEAGEDQDSGVGIELM